MCRSAESAFESLVAVTVAVTVQGGGVEREGTGRERREGKGGSRRCVLALEV